MELRVKDFAKISEADIIIDGITIIDGNNNTGKSTIGKILDTLFNTTNNIKEKMNKARADSLREMLQKELQQAYVKESSYFTENHQMRTVASYAASELIKGEKCEKICKWCLRELGLTLNKIE